MNPEISWVYDILNSTNIQEEMRNFKIKATPEEICKGERCQCLIPICQEAYSIGFMDEPQYGKLIFMLEMELFKMFCIPDNVFNFMQKSSSFVGRSINSNAPLVQAPDQETDVGDIPDTEETEDERVTKLKG
jgi:hypothetical protein